MPHVSTIDGDQVAEIMVANCLGTRPDTETLDEDYFGIYEAPAGLADRRAIYQVTPAREISPEDNLVSLRALSYALRVDATTIRGWIERGLLAPDVAGGEGAYFTTGASCRPVARDCSELPTWERLDNARQPFVKQLPEVDQPVLAAS